nr:MAG TPA_asm: Baseplate J like protein [Caudoviricetes sp.]
MALEFISDMSTKALFNSIKAQYKTETGEDLEIGSNEFAIASAVAYVFGGMVERFNDMAANRYIDTARGEYLDALAKNLGVTRPRATPAKCTVLISNQINAEITINAHSVTIDDGNGHEFEPDLIYKEPSGGGGGVIQTFDVKAGEIRALQFRSKTTDESNNDIAAFTMKLEKEYGDGKIIYLQVTETKGANPNAYPYTTEGDDAFRAIIPDMAARIRSAGSQAYYNAWCRKYSPYILDAYCLVDGDDGFVAGEVRIFVSVIDGADLAIFDVTAMKRALEADQNRPINDFIADVSICGEEYPNVTYDVYFDPMRIGRDKADEIAATACQRLKDYYMRNIGMDVALQRFNEIVAELDTSGGILAARQIVEGAQTYSAEVMPVKQSNIASKTFNYNVIAKNDQ